MPHLIKGGATTPKRGAMFDVDTVYKRCVRLFGYDISIA